MDDAAGASPSGTPQQEAARTFQKLLAVTEAAGFARHEIVYVDLALVDLADLGEVHSLYAELSPEGRLPARTIYRAAALPSGARIKVQAVAVRED